MEQFDLLLKKRWLPLQLFTAGVVILLLTVWLWWGKVSVEPQRVFAGMLQNSLSTSGVTVTLNQKDGADTIEQAIQLHLGAEPFARSVTTVSRAGDRVTTETLGTRDADYTRYTNIATSRKGPDGKPLDVSQLKNVWAKTPAAELAQQQAAPLFQLAALGVGMPLGTLPVPMGNLSSEQRAALLQQIREDNVYAIDMGKIKNRSHNGRLAYAYELQLQPVLYVRMMQRFAQALGLPELDQVDPNSFSGQAPLKMTLVVDAHARQLVAVEFPNKNYRQTYSGHGLFGQPNVPKQTITGAELQKRLSVLNGT